MRARQPVPTVWLMTDERTDATLEAALRRLPRGAGIVFRHYALARAERRRRFEQVRSIARARGLVLLLAGERRDTLGWRADGWHSGMSHRLPMRARFRTAPAHNVRESVAARRARSDLIFLSPVFATRSHSGARSLGPVRFGQIATSSGMIVIALGGMTAHRYRRLVQLGATGWAAIDAWSA